MSESALVARLLAAYNRGPVRLFRNTTGFVKVGRRGIHYGLCVGSSDLIGWRTVPRGVAQFVAIECKSGQRRVTVEQQAFLVAVLAAGGIAGVVRSMEEAALLLGPPP